MRPTAVEFDSTQRAREIIADLRREGLPVTRRELHRRGVNHVTMEFVLGEEQIRVERKYYDSVDAWERALPVDKVNCWCVMMEAAFALADVAGVRGLLDLDDMEAGGGGGPAQEAHRRAEQGAGG